MSASYHLLNVDAKVPPRYRWPATAATARCSKVRCNSRSAISIRATAPISAPRASMWKCVSPSAAAATGEDAARPVGAQYVAGRVGIDQLGPALADDGPIADAHAAAAAQDHRRAGERPEDRAAAAAEAEDAAERRAAGAAEEAIERAGEQLLRQPFKGAHHVLDGVADEVFPAVGGGAAVGEGPAEIVQDGAARLDDGVLQLLLLFDGLLVSRVGILDRLRRLAHGEIVLLLADKVLVQQLVIFVDEVVVLLLRRRDRGDERLGLGVQSILFDLRRVGLVERVDLAGNALSGFVRIPTLAWRKALSSRI